MFIVLFVHSEKLEIEQCVVVYQLEYSLFYCFANAIVLTNVYSWRQKSDEQKGLLGAQIDLLIDRNDQVVNLCEIKYSKAEYAISKEYESTLRQKIEAFRVGSGSRKAIHLTMITTYGLTDNPYAQTVQNCITMDDLFLS